MIVTYISDLFVLLFFPFWLCFSAVHEKLLHSDVHVIYSVCNKKKMLKNNLVTMRVTIQLCMGRCWRLCHISQVCINQIKQYL